jgi:pyrroline-5-carboxylate reductase
MVLTFAEAAHLLQTAMASILKIGFLGAGKMANALAKGFVNAKLIEPGQMMASDVLEGARSAFNWAVGAAATAENAEVARFARVLVLAVKPDQVADALKEVRMDFTEDHLLISIVAGTPIKKLEELLKHNRPRVIRVMPNAPALVGASATAFALSRGATKADGQLALNLFSSVGIAFEVKESLLDAVTGLSGSGPAYAFMMIEALSDGGVAAGLPRDMATRLAAQTLLGAGKMLLESNSHPGVLKDLVTSPGGTTIEGVHELEKAGVRGALMNAVRAASEKSRQLGQQ